MWMRQVTAFELKHAAPETWEDALSQLPVTDPPPGQARTIGFEPMPETGTFVDKSGAFYAIQGVMAERLLPRDVVDREVARRGKAKAELASDTEVSDEEADKVAKAAWAEVYQELLDKSPIRERKILAVFDQERERLYVFGSGRHAEDVIIAGLRKAIDGSVPAVLLQPRDAVEPVLTRWLADGELPAPLTLADSAVLNSQDVEGGKITFKGVDLSDPTIRQHLEHGDTVERVDVVWNGQLCLTVNAKGELRNIAPPECQMKAQFIAAIWVEVMGLLPKMIDDLMRVMGGVRATDTAVETVVRPVRIAVVACDQGPGNVAHLLSRLDAVRLKRPISEIIIPALANDRMRAVYKWAEGVNVARKLVKPSQEGEGWVEAVINHRPRALLTYGSGHEVNSLVTAAMDSKVTIMDLTPNS